MNIISEYIHFNKSNISSVNFSIFIFYVIYLINDLLHYLKGLFTTFFRA